MRWVTLADRHRGALQEDYTDMMHGRGGPLRTNVGSGGGELDSNLLSTGAKLNDSDLLDSLLTIGISEVDDRVLAYISSNTDDIQGVIDKLGRMLLITTTTKTELPEDTLRELIQKLDNLIWKIRDYTNQHNLVAPNK